MLPRHKNTRYLIFILALILSNVEVSQFINIPVLVGSNHPKPIPHIVFLQVLLSQVLEIPEKHRVKVKPSVEKTEKKKERNNMHDIDIIGRWKMSFMNQITLQGKYSMLHPHLTFTSNFKR